MVHVPIVARRAALSRVTLVLFAGGLIAVGLIGFAALPGEADHSLRPEVQPAPTGPSGVVTYELGTGEIVSTTALGNRVVAARTVVEPGVSTASDRWPAPDGRTIVAAQRTSDGVFLTSSASGPGVQAWIAGPDSPALVEGGKAPAAAVKGVPLVVAWSPDSTLVAYGSLTGEPFYLNITSPGLIGAGRTFDLSGGYVGELAWSPNGRYLGISTYTMDRKNHTTFIYDRQTGTVTRLIDGCHITWSPDSKYVAVHRDPAPEPGTWIVSIDAGQRYALTTDPTAYPEMWQPS